MRNEPGRRRRRKSLVRIGCANALAAILAVGLATPSLADKRHRHHPGHGHHGHRAAVFPGLGLSSLAQHHFRAHRHWHGRRLPPGVHRPRPTVVYVLPGVRYAAPAAVPARIAVARRPAAPPPDCLAIREYQTRIVVGGREVEAYGDACLQPDGSWRTGPPKVMPR